MITIYHNETYYAEAESMGHAERIIAGDLCDELGDDFEVSWDEPECGCIYVSSERWRK